MLTVTVYTTGASCMCCTLTKKAPDKEGVLFVEVDVRENAEARACITEDLGRSQAPCASSRTTRDRTTGSAFDPTISSE